MSEFDDAFAELYEAFAGLPPKEIFGCYCCLDQPQRDLLLCKPLRELTSEDLSQYAFSVFLTLGDLSDYRYFLPRIFEVSATDLDWWPSPEVVLRALALADWTEWPRQRDAIEAVLRAWLDRWASRRLNDSRWNEIDSLLCGMARAGLEIAPYLERLLAPDNLLGLRELLALNGNSAESGGRPENFWEDAPDSWRQLTQFLTSDAVRERLSEVR